MIETNENKEII